MITHLNPFILPDRLIITYRNNTKQKTPPLRKNSFFIASFRLKNPLADSEIALMRQEQISAAGKTLAAHITSSLEYNYYYGKNK